ncbi:MAG: hypothetical protein JWQ36_2646 [Enterovirga sp.]|jgi:hypothetical protein|nr:hypothetical protein [Enterovirga sp.]
MRSAIAGVVLAVAGAGGAGAVEQVAGASLALSASSGSCQLQWTTQGGAGDLELGLPQPCQFHRDRNGAIRIRSVGSAEHVLVESVTRSPESPGQCVTQIRGIAVAAGAVAASPHVSKVAACPPVQWDEKMFIGLF